MKEPTRQLIALLADDLTRELIAALRDGTRTTPELVAASGATHRTVAQALALLRAHGVVAPAEPRPGRRGRPPDAWRLVEDKRLRSFEKACDDLKKALLGAQLDQFG